MSRRPVLTPEGIARVRQDPRYVGALAARGPRAVDWRSQGACAKADPETFFPELHTEQAEAVAVCGRCTVQSLCLLTALEGGEPEGVWGAATPRERRLMRAVMQLPARPTRVVAAG